MELQGSLLFVLILLVVCDIVAMKEDGHSGVKSGSRKGLNNPRIIGGQFAKIEDFPFIVSIQKTRVKNLTMFNFHNCGGTLVGLSWVLTAGHCHSDGTDFTYQVVAGSTNSLEVPNGREGFKQVRLVKKFFVHEQYSSINKENDIGLIQLVTAMVPSTHVQVKIVFAHRDLKPGTICTAAGWGDTHAKRRTLKPEVRSVIVDQNATQKIASSLEDYRRNVPEELLRQVRLPFIEHATCLAMLRKIYQNSKFFLLDEKKNVCLRVEPGKTTCSGDSGGPLLCNGYLTGVSSYGTGCTQGIPDVYTKVAYFKPWIDKTIETATP